MHTTEFIQDTKKRQLMTRSGLQRLRCDVCHLLHKQTMTASAATQQFFKTVLQQVHHFKTDVIAGDVNTTACRYYKKASIPRSVQFISCRYVERDAT